MQTEPSVEPIIAPAGGAFLTKALEPSQVFTPEDQSAEALLMARAVERFMRREVLPLTMRLEAQEPGLSRLMRRAGEIGILGVNLPSELGGLNLPKTSVALLTEQLALNAAFAVGVGVHFGVGVLPLYYFGTEDQKHAYLPKLASGEWIGAFALSEPNSGSDALAAQTTATLTPDGTHYLLNGAKAWITNAGHADLFTVFAKVDGTQFTAFLVPRDTPGLSVGPEEEKLGLKASSTRALILQNARVPIENVLGSVGKGHQPALYALNSGRLTIAATALGMANEAFRSAVTYAVQREQFGHSLAHLPLIRQKLAQMAVKTYALESMVYRVAGAWDALMQVRLPRPNSGEPKQRDKLGSVRAASEEYAIECSILKFYGTEVLRDVIDEALQIHGGYGFSEKYPIARAYRDARVFRIFEGTNEVNRLTAMDQWFKRINAGRLALGEFLFGSPESGREGSDAAAMGVDRLRQAVQLLLHHVHGRWSGWTREEIARQQEILALLADCCADLFACESASLRSSKMQANPAVSAASASLAQSATFILIDHALTQTEARARTILAVQPNDALRCSVRDLLDPLGIDTIVLTRSIAASVLDAMAHSTRA